eukprot:gnl/MRDRNA2_/MRDRNA2_27207_c0_seq2.p2 gnl/MRDRNA2_/MRDRNA2_27207_c0~~gnl/MRDRNA2_/MRDRNA2_27207_c0_seq2.p2  ORF type:complete len:117 (+),score=18.92 gnl/MRDRNA2_/MRDRNA2_27207_c0_seq2:320-670(+)
MHRKNHVMPSPTPPTSIISRNDSISQKQKTKDDCSDICSEQLDSDEVFDAVKGELTDNKVVAKEAIKAMRKVTCEGENGESNCAEFFAAIQSSGSDPVEASDKAEYYSGVQWGETE